jgi:hypothetical protein
MQRKDRGRKEAKEVCAVVYVHVVEYFERWVQEALACSQFP